MAYQSEMDVVLHGSLRKDFPTDHILNLQMLAHFQKNPCEHGSPTVPMLWRSQSTPRTVFKQDFVERKPGSSKRAPAAVTESS
ncbi:hypothetical protein AVEN_211624-1 [Araneus ventricosus]|uniref:Uncharacterized protein n=1 Tax=Araneus ventricosus TaxID=182803 RepID=A0A4Y2M2F1_ARAVE|nr:hypothetical protein AVEN_7310-1 [Araneus ventricosus]GBN21176.1 hypothetical protein AVEN_226910-1 [Araneus ventricosus]GBN21276.1 hypothetical protein AVEN_54466-1 [Araneus ventricosus]GBN21469.1 hypothetical protein AVEN_211624-1 [Araneus ventricosus]